MEERPFLFAILAALIAAGAAAQPSRAPRGALSCGEGPGESVVIRAVEADGGLRLQDGRSIRLAGLDFGLDALDAEGWDRQRKQLAGELEGRQARFQPAISVADRWGRLPGHLVEIGANGGAKPASLGVRLVELGLARVRVGDGVDHCLAEALRAEIGARRGNSGLWSRDGTKLLDAADPAGLKSLAGRYVVLEGKVVSVGERTARTYLNFGRRFNRDFAATVPKRFLARLQSAGITPSSLAQKRVRLRGYVGGWRAPRLEIVSAAQVEVVEERRP